MDLEKPTEHERSCASCYWFIPIFGGVKRCCCGVSPLCGNDEAGKVCEHWSKDRPSSRSMETGKGKHETNNGDLNLLAGDDIDFS